MQLEQLLTGLFVCLHLCCHHCCLSEEAGLSHDQLKVFEIAEQAAAPFAAIITGAVKATHKRKVCEDVMAKQFSPGSAAPLWYSTACSEQVSILVTFPDVSKLMRMHTWPVSCVSPAGYV